MKRTLYSLCLALGFLFVGNQTWAQAPVSSGADASSEYQQTPPSEVPEVVQEAIISKSLFDRTYTKKGNSKAPSKASLFVRKAGNAIAGIAFGNPVKTLVPKYNIAKAQQSSPSLNYLLWIILVIILIALLLNLVAKVAPGPIYGGALGLIILIVIILWLMGAL